VEAQLDVCVVRIEPGAQNTVTPVIAGAVVTTMAAEPDFVVSCVDVAVMVAVPAVELGVNTPEPVMLPAVLGLTDHVTVLA
jgi:hypothetical protein